MSTPDPNSDTAPGVLENATLLNFDSIESGYELLRQIVRGDVEPIPGADITDDAVDLLTALETAHREVLSMLYGQTTALDRLRRGVAAAYGLDYETLVEA